MQINSSKLKVCFVMKAAFLAICAVFLALPARAQTSETLKMTNGTRQVPANGYLFYDSGGPLLFDPATDPENANEYNWTTWYQHNEEYTLTLTVPEGYGIEVEFTKLLINNDFLSFYEGNTVAEENLIGTFTNNDYSTSLCSATNPFTVASHGNMTLHFSSDFHWRDEGWEAVVRRVQTSNFAPQPPVAVMAACDNMMSLLSTTKGDESTVLQYKVGSGAYQTYTPGALIDLNSQTYPLTVTVKSVVDDVASVEKHFTFDHKITAPGKPTYVPNPSNNTITVYFPNKPAGVNDTYYIRWTINNNPNDSTAANYVAEDPRLWEESGHEFQQPNNTPNTVPAGVIDYTNVTLSTPFYIHFATRGTTCPNDFSWVRTVEITQRNVPMPTITFATNGSNQGVTTLACSLEGATIYYTTDGSEPTTSSTSYSGSTFIVAPGTTVKAIAVKTGYTTSAVTSAIFVPGGESGDPQSGTYGSVVLLDDREDHSWSYYSDETSPIKSLNPADVKITYYGNSPAGRTTMTNASENGNTPTSFSATATGVQVNVGETENQFIYLKTLEAANADGSGGYPYSMIPNPFQVRPNNNTTTTATERTIYINWGRGGSGGNTQATGTLQITYTNASGQHVSQTYTINSTSSATITAKVGTTVEYSLIKTNTANQNRRYVYFTAGYNNNGTQLITQQTCYSTTTATTGTSGSIAAPDPVTTYDWRGFYAWRIKSLSNGLAITGKNVGDLVYADEEITFETSNEEGNEVEFEALWAQAYVTECSTANGLSNAIASSSLNANVSYERNFVVVTNGAQTNAITNTSQKPVTISQLYPDGTGTMSSSNYLAGDFNANNDTKFENIYMGGQSVAFYIYTYYMTFRTGSWFFGYTYYYYNENNGWVTSMDDATPYTFQVAQADDPGYTLNYFGYGTGQYVNNQYEINYYFTNKTSTTLNVSGDYDSRYNDLVFGRGIITVGDRSAGMFTGYYTSSVETYSGTTPNFKLRLESGTIRNFNPMGYCSSNSGYLTLTGTPYVNVILGSDYDRAKKANDKLSIDYIYGGGSVVFSTEANKEAINIDYNVKSGTYNTTIGAGEQNYSFYMGVLPNGCQYEGGRRLLVEGGSFKSISGGLDQTEYGSTTHENVYIRMKGGEVLGSIYGAAAYVGATGGRRFVFTGGTIDGWIAGGCNGTHIDGGELYGDVNIYFGGKAQVGNQNGGTHVGGNVTYTEQGTTGYGINGADGGIIFGAGCGINPTNSSYVPNGNYQSNTVGRVNNSTVVVSDDAIVWRDLYGGGNYGYIRDNGTSNIHILGGTVKGNVYGGANSQQSQTVNITMKNGEVVGNIYGGSNAWGTANGLATITINNGTVTNVFGGGYGEDTEMAANTKVNINGGTINNNVYGGGEEGTVGAASTPANTEVNIGGGTMKNVFGAGKGKAAVGSTPAQTADINGQTLVKVTGGTMENVYGGGEAGNVVNGTNLASTVTIQGGSINEDVFGGGRLGKTTGNVRVNVFDGSIAGNVYGGAFGKRNEVFIAGTHTVNVTGGNIYTNVYGGSRNANDALTFSPATGGSDAINHVNISGGHIYYQVFGSGYFGHTYGSVYVFVGQNAINNAPNAAPTAGVNYNAAALLIDGSVWAGADFGNFDGEEFGEATIEGYSNIYIDGLGYNTVSTQPSDAGYMNIGGSVFGSGTSCYAGIQGRDLILRNYGQAVENPNYGSKEAIIEPYTTATRNLKSIQFFNNAVIDQAHVHFIGQGRINSLVATEKYSIYEIATVARVTNGSSLFLDFPMDQIMKLGSYVCNDVYVASPSFTVVDYTDLPTTGHDNKFRVNNGAFINVKYLGGYGTGKDYGELQGFFYMMTEDENNTCAYARPKQSTDLGNQIDPNYDNPNDGGFLCYDASYNTYNITGGTANPGVQMPYENHTLTSKFGEQYFRIWRYGGIYCYREGVFNAVAKTDDGYSTVDVVISLPASRGDGSYFRIKTIDGFPAVDYGSDVMTVNAGVYNSTNGVPASNGWMYYDATANTFVYPNAADQTNVADGLAQMQLNVNANFGLVAIPNGSLVGGSNSDWLICTAASDEGEALSNTTWVNMNNTINPSILFRLTYNNHLTNNVTWDPIIITFEQCDAQGNVKDEIEVALSVNTSTTIEQDFTAQTYALMDTHGTQAETYVAKVVLPGYIPYVNVEGDLSEWSFVSAEWRPATSEFTGAWQKGSDYVHNPAVNNQFSMQIQPSYNFDNTLGWTSYDHTAHDLKVMQDNDQHPVLSSTDGRNPAALDFILHFDGRAKCYSTEKMGVLHVVLHFTNYGASNASDHGKDLVIDVEVWRRGEGIFYYLDGVHGNNFYSGTYPNAPKKTLSGIFNHSNYQPGDVIFIVNTVTANSANALDWNGEQYGEVVIYRYPGGHPLNLSGEDPVYENYDVTNNLGFGGTLVKVERSMSMHGIVLDGFYYVKDTTNFAQYGGNLYYPIQEKYVTPTSPLVEIAENASLTVYSDSRLQWNYTDSDGGAVYNAGELILRGGSRIMHNAVLSNSYNGAGVYLDEGATLIVSDEVTIDTNHIVTHEHVAVHGTDKNNNVYLAAANSVVQVGTVDPTDGLSALENTSRIGVTKGEWGQYYYTPIAYSDGGMDYLGNIIPEHPQTAQARDYLIFDDDLYYPLVTLNNTPGYEPNYDYLFWVGTWVTTVRTQPAGFNPDAIDTPEELAWAISIVNGLNTVTSPQNNTNFNITADIDMKARIWVPMGTSTAPYLGHFNANGHVIEGVRSPLNSEDMGMFGYVGNNANIENMVLNVDFSGGNSVNMAALAANMTGGTISNVEAAGTITGSSTTEVMGGLVANKDGGTIHSSFAVNTMTTTNADSDMGGLVGINTGDLLNSYSNAIMSGADRIGGLAGVNNGRIENCYVVLGNQTFPAFAYDNTGHNINYCYAAEGITNYVTAGNEGTLKGHGNYAPVFNRKEIGYMYGDNKVNAANKFVTLHEQAHEYIDSHIVVWDGLLSVLNQWVNSTSDTIQKPAGMTKWHRPISLDINGDLPVLAFPKDNCLVTTDGKYLQYSATVYDQQTKRNDAMNGIDVLLDQYSGQTASIFLYKDATNVANIPGTNVMVSINEDAVLLQADNAGEFKNAIVGITFENSCRGADDYFGNMLEYDWHLMSTPLSNASLGISYGDNTTDYNYWDHPDTDKGQAISVQNSYMPNMTRETMTSAWPISWDFYTYYEPQYHWINFKRNINSHHHYEEPHAQITYTGMEQTAEDEQGNLIRGRGYMMAINQDSYLNNSGILNKGEVPIALTVSGTLPETELPSKDWGSNLVGNPYQAYLNLDSVASVNGVNSFYVYDADEGVYGPYMTGASVNSVTPSQYIHPHQAFFAVTTVAKPQFKFKYSMATVLNNETSYFRGEEQPRYPLVNIFAENEAGNRDLAIIEFLRPELDGVRKVSNLHNANFSLSAHLGGEGYGLVFAPEGTERIPVHFKLSEDGTYTLRWNTENGNFTSLRLVDNKTGVNYDMLANDHYTFEASVEDFASRFYITYACTGLEENGTVSGDSFAFFDGSEWVIDGKGQLDVIDVLGRVVYSTRLTDEQNRVNLNMMAPGTYLMRVIDKKNVKVQKVVVR